jgi:multisubunit Na+/H+ antiporter MnhE subunit
VAILPLGLLWLLLAGPEPAAWLVGAPAVAVAAAGVLAMPRPDPVDFRPVAFARLIVAFLRDSVRGASDVAARCVARDMRLRPKVVRWRTSLRSPIARLCLIHAISLVPGTLCARAHHDALHVHVLDEDSPWRDDLAALEARIAAAFEPGAAESP